MSFFAGDWLFFNGLGEMLLVRRDGGIQFSESRDWISHHSLDGVQKLERLGPFGQVRHGLVLKSGSRFSCSVWTVP